MARSRIAVLPVVMVALAAAATVVLPGLRPPSFHGTDLGPGSEPHEFTLEAADRPPVRLSDYRGRVVVLFFGYTSCPDVCPLTMTRLREVMERLGDRRGDVQVVLVTVDPEVDTPARLREYVQSFDLGFVGLGGDRETLAAVARSFGAWGGAPQPAAPDPAPASHDGHHGAEVPGDVAEATGAPGSDAPAAAAARMIPHTSHVFGLDRQGRLRVLWGPELTAAELAEDLRGLLRI